MKHFCASLLLLFTVSFALHAQETAIGKEQAIVSPKLPSSAQSLLNEGLLVQDTRVDSVLIWHVAMNKRKKGLEGYRLEIFFGSDQNAREKALEVKTEFLKKYPDLDAYIQFQAPNFRVRVGNFRTKSEALQVKARIRKHYPNAFRVDDIIQYPQLLTEQREE